MVNTSRILPPIGKPGGPLAVAVTPADILSAIADRVGAAGVSSKAALVRELQMPRSTVTSHVDWLLNRGILEYQSGSRQLARGRPAGLVALNGSAGCILTVEMGTAKSTLAVVDLAGRVLARRQIVLRAKDGPESGLDLMASNLEDLIDEADQTGYRIPPPSNRVLSLALPARIEITSGKALRPLTMPAWDGFPILEYLEDRLGCQTILENDCMVRAYGEAAVLGGTALPLISVQIGNGIGAGIIDDGGNIIHGANGAAGEIAHIPFPGSGDEVCSCGSRGCVETVASVSAMLRRLEPSGLIDPDGPVDFEQLATLLHQRNQKALEVVRESAEAVGVVVATLCNFMNPRRVVITGGLVNASHDLLATIRSVVYAQARPLATKDLIIDQSRLGSDLGIAGAYLLGRQHFLSAANIDSIRLRSPKD